MITPEEKEKIIQTLKEENLEEFMYIINSADPRKMLERLLETKNKIKSIIEKYENGNNKVAFEKANNSNVYISVENSDAIADIKDPLEISFEDFIQKFKPKMVWHKNGVGNYSTLLGKYRFAKDYKVVVIRIPFTDKDMIKIATKLSRNIYPLSGRLGELMPLGFVLFIP
jgi:uncharacterized protein (DUF2249 family)